MDLQYPDDWDTLVLKPGDSVDVKGTLRGVSDVHTDRASVSGEPLLPCVASDEDPFDGVDGTDSTPEGAVEIDGQLLCGDTTVVSNVDDWNGRKSQSLAITGSGIVWMAVGVAALLALGAGLMLMRRRGLVGAGHGSHGSHARVARMAVGPDVSSTSTDMPSDPPHDEE